MTVNLALLGLAPANSSWALVAFIIFLERFRLFGAALNISVMSALADIADEHELEDRPKTRRDFYSARAFFAKAMNAIGHVVAGLALQYYVMLPPSRVPGDVAPDIIRWAYGMTVRLL